MAKVVSVAAMAAVGAMLVAGCSPVNENNSQENPASSDFESFWVQTERGSVWCVGRHLGLNNAVMSCDFSTLGKQK